jgi:hypothetical protein
VDKHLDDTTFRWLLPRSGEESSRVKSQNDLAGFFSVSWSRFGRLAVFYFRSSLKAAAYESCRFTDLTED